MKNNRTYREIPITPRTRPIINGAELREVRDLAEVAVVLLDETAEGPAEVDFDSYRPRLDALGISVLDRVERITDTAPNAGQIAVETFEQDAVVLQFPGRTAPADR